MIPAPPHTPIPQRSQLDTQPGGGGEPSSVSPVFGLLDPLGRLMWFSHKACRRRKRGEGEAAWTNRNVPGEPSRTQDPGLGSRYLAAARLDACPRQP